MDDSRDALANLVSGAGKEIARLARVEAVDVRDELRFRVWPFLAELGETLSAMLDAEGDDASVPVDVIARAVGFMVTLIDALGEHRPSAEMEELARKAALIMEELMALCDPDELAEYVAEGGVPSGDFDAEAAETNTRATSASEIIDTTAEIVESVASTEKPRSLEASES